MAAIRYGISHFFLFSPSFSVTQPVKPEVIFLTISTERDVYWACAGMYKDALFGMHGLFFYLFLCVCGQCQSLRLYCLWQSISSSGNGKCLVVFYHAGVPCGTFLLCIFTHLPGNSLFLSLHPSSVLGT